MGRFGSITLAGLGGTLLLILGSEIADAVQWLDQPGPAIIPTLDSGAWDKDTPTAAAPKATDVAAILARPLFNWTRRQGASAGATDAGSMPRLSGILVSASQRYAIFAAQPGGKSQVVPEGGAVGRFTIDKITPDHVILKGGADSQTLQVTFSTAPPPPMATPDAS